MSHGGGNLASSSGREIGKQCGGELTGNVGEGVAVEEEEGSLAVAVAKEIQRVLKGGYGVSLFFPLCCCRCLSLSIKAVLRSTSLARSSVEADDKLPTPVFEKLGSGL